MSSTDVTIALRWSDQDANGHLNHARIVTLMEEARVRWIRTEDGFARLLMGVVVASMTVDYLAQAEYIPSMTIGLGIERIGTKSFTLRHTGVQDGTTVFVGTTVIVPLAADGAASRALTDDEREALGRHLVHDPAE
ncbi:MULTISPECIES: acyl-CoA thioesterase [Arthrobacter]|uniref:acyl-CoA thioesterase n=1 Tax=Arthrobacter TaxID=1663 RepID=UPI00265606CB|nr:acyl-CoA thioesterase [Micrococcaceae bacterium]